MAMILIAILLERTDAGELFPGEIKAYPTAEFDSLFAGVDCVLEFRRGDRTALHLGLCMEAVVEGEDVWDPFDETREELERDALASVTYFHSEWLNFMGTITLPRLLVALDAKSIADMLKPWQKQTGWFPGSQGRATIVQSILAQLAVQEAFAERAGAPQSLARLREVRSGAPRATDLFGYAARDERRVAGGCARRHPPAAAGSLLLDRPRREALAIRVG
ncbi:MAG: hypothetical protein M5U13_15585 [Thermoanaerobaculia bacterium]|nr:hypothetical protein [Thermoanaerobaculia bacterium]